MALNAYLTIEGPNGPIEGSTTSVEHQGKIEVWSAHHEIIDNYDLNNPGGAQMPPQHRPLRVTKPVDQASPLLVELASSGQVLPRVMLELFEFDETGATRASYTLELEQVVIAGVRLEMLDNRYVDNVDQPVKEVVTLAYGIITWTHEPSGFQAKVNLVNP